MSQALKTDLGICLLEKQRWYTTAHFYKYYIAHSLHKDIDHFTSSVYLQHLTRLPWYWVQWDCTPAEKIILMYYP